MHLPSRVLAGTAIAAALVIGPAVAAHADSGSEDVTVHLDNAALPNGGCIHIHLGEATTGITIINTGVCLP